MSKARLVVFVLTLLPTTGAAQPLAPNELLNRARAYVAQYEEEFPLLVSEERYTQEVRLPPGSSLARPRGLGLPSAPPAAASRSRQQLVSSYIIVKLPETGEWAPFRDVFEVDGKPVRDRDDRLMRLFASADASRLDQAARIMAESTRHNIGDLHRTINIPVLALLFLRSTYAGQFTFTFVKNETVDDRPTAVFRFRETGRPSIVRTGAGGRQDLPSAGRVWIERETGRVLRTEHIADMPGVDATVTVIYRDDPGLRMLVPGEMLEVYQLSRPTSTVRGVATYSKYQRLHVSTEERIGDATQQTRTPAAAAVAERAPLDVARVLAARYPAGPIMSYIPALAWSGSLRLAQLTGDDKWKEKPRREMQPFLDGAKPAIATPSALTSLAGHLAFSDLAALDHNEAAAALALKAAEFILPEKPGDNVRFARNWTDDMFMASSLLSRVAVRSKDDRFAQVVGRLLTSYAEKLQRPDGLFIHAADGPHAWGRGNGFALLGLTEALTYLPESWPERARVLEIYRRHVKALLAHQSDDGSWRQVVDEPASYRELTVTAMTVAAMARGLRLGWLDASVRPAIDRGWTAVLTRVGEDGTVRDVCASTGAGPTKEYYLNRPAVNGADDRGGAMALLAALEMHELQGLGR